MNPDDIPEIALPEKDNDVTTCLTQLAERCYELGESHTAASLLTLIGARLGDGKSIGSFSALANFWTQMELVRMNEEDKSKEGN